MPNEIHYLTLPYLTVQCSTVQNSTLVMSPSSGMIEEPVPRSIAVLQYRGIAVSQYRNITVLQYHSIVVSQYHSITVLQYRSITVSQSTLLYRADYNTFLCSAVQYIHQTWDIPLPRTVSRL